MPVRLTILLLLLLGASAASAQAPAPAPTLPAPPLISAPEGDEPQEPPPAARARPSPEATLPEDADGAWAGDAPVRQERLSRRPVPEETGFAPRLGVELLGGTAGGVVGGGAGFLAGFALGLATVGCDSFECLVTGAVGGLIGVVLGVPAGTYFSGTLLGGRGTFGAALAGGVVGAGVAGLGLGLTSGQSDIFSYALLSLPMLGASLAYEYSHAHHPSEAPAPTASRPRLMPLAGYTADGLQLGLAGHF